MIDREWRYGVYMKRTGKLVLLEDPQDTQHKYALSDGRKTKNPLIKALLGNVYMAWHSNSLGWGPTTFMKTAEYLGPL